MFFKQLRYLIKKNFILRRRRKCWTAVELIWPLVLFLILVWVRTRDLTDKHLYCHYSAKAMPSTGLSPFIQSYICTLQNRCSQEPTIDGDIGIVGDEEQSLLGLVVSLVETLFNSTTKVDSMESVVQTAANILRTFSSLDPVKGSNQTGVVTENLLNADGRQDLSDLLVKSGISPETAKLFLQSTLTPQFFSLVLVNLYLSGSSFTPPNVAFYERTKQEIFCDKTELGKSVEAKSAKELQQIQEEFCGAWNTTVFAKGSDGIFFKWLDWSTSTKALSLAMSNLTGFNISPTQIFLLGTELMVLGEELKDPELKAALSQFKNLTEPFRNSSPNESFAALTCGGSYQDWEKAFDSGSTFEQIRDKYQTRKEERMERQKFKWEEEGEQEKILNSVNDTLNTPKDFPKIKNATEKIVCGGIPIDTQKATKCWDLLGEIGFPEMFRVQIYSLLQGFILVTPSDTPVVANVVKELSVFLNSLDMIRDKISSLYHNTDKYQDAILLSDVGKGIKIMETVLDRLNKTGILDSALSKNETESLSWTVSVVKQLLANSSDPNTTLAELKRRIKPAVNLLECFRTDRFIFVDSEDLMERLGTCLIDYFMYLSGIVFKVKQGSRKFSSLTTYKIRMANFLVDGPRLMDRIWSSRPRNRAFIDQKYLYFGFSFLQDAVDKAIIRNQTESLTETGVYAQEFPSPCYNIDTFERVLAGMMPLFMTLSWVLMAALIIKNIVYEKERRLKEVMKVMGLSNLVHWVAWFISAFVVVLVSVTLLALLLKFGRVTEATDPTVLFVFLMLYAIATITQCFLISTLFSKANLAAAAGAIIYFLLYIPYAVLRPRAETIGYTEKTVSCLLSQVAFGWGSASLAAWEEEGSGLQWSNMASSPVVYEEFNFLTAMLMLLVDSAIHIIFTWYIEAVCPGEYGISRPLYFPFMKSYWCGHSLNAIEVETGDKSSSGPAPDKLGSEPRELPLGVCIKNLTKKYSNGKVAVDGLSVNFYESQITSFLGHNGAGKTTTMSILTGLYPPTSGTALIYGRDIRTDFDEIRKSVGMCPQHNVLFDDLTVEEQLKFYAGLKGVKDNEMEKEVNKNILDVDLALKRSTLAKSLSGGMKRKLSIAVAFIGGSKTVILDEPTAGVDPYARRGIWDLLNGYRQGRTIILSTHHMDEADILGDRIAIISGGKLKCCGSSIFLKKRFGSGYHLTLIKSPILTAERKKKQKKKKKEGTVDLIPLSKLTPIKNGSVVGALNEPSFLPPIGGVSTSSTSVCSSLSRSSSHSAQASDGERPTRSDDVGEFVRDRIPGGFLREDYGTELVFTLPITDPTVLEGFFEDLDENMDGVGVTAYGVSDTTLEEIFLQMVGDEGGEEFKRKAACDCCPSLRNKLRIRFSGKQPTLQATEEADLVDSEEEIDWTTNASHPKISSMKRGRLALTKRRMRALLAKRFHNFRRNLKGAFAEILLPVVLVAFTMLLMKVIPTNPENPPQLLLTPWLYGTEEAPNIIFFSSDSIRPKANNLSKKVLDTFLSPPGLGVRCMRNSPFKEYYPCKKGSEKWKGNPYSGNYSVPDNMCYCDTDFRGGTYDYICAKDAYKPVPIRLTTNTTDIMVNMTGRNVSQWLLMTEKKYRKQRFGGFSLGEVNKQALKNRSIDQMTVEAERFVTFLGKISLELNISWNVDNQTEQKNRTESAGEQLRNLLSGIDVKNNIKVWFNNQGWASLPAYMNTLSNSMLRSVLPKSRDPSKYGIITYNHPMNYSKQQQIGSIEGGGNAGPRESFEATMVILAFSVVPASFVLFVIDERVTHAKHLQFVSGVGPILYWVSNFIWDMLNFMIPVSLCMLLFFVFGVDSLVGDARTAFATFFLFVFYGFAIVPVMYPFCFCFRVPSLAFITLTIGNFFLGIVSTLTTATLEVLGQSEGDQDLLSINNICKKVFLILPQYCLGRGILDLKISYLYYSSIKKIFGSARVPDPFAWDQIGRNLVCMAAQGIIGFTIVLFIEYRYVIYNCRCRKKSRSRAGSRNNDEEDHDVAEERRRVISGQAEDAAVCISGLTKLYKKDQMCGCGGFELAAVNDLCLGIKTGECFGLLGVNGAGKTTTFKMLTGKTPMSSGDATFNGLSVKRDINRVHQMIGYCPQFDALHGLLTGKEQLAFYARLRGIEEKDIKRVVSWALNHMHLKSHGSQLTRNYSGGNKRKLSTALALIGNPAVVLLDEPTTGMDPKARRFLWNRITDIVREDRCVILTSHSMEECETLCNRIAIMVGGQMKCLGSVQHLKNKFGDGYTLSMILYDRSSGSVDAAVSFVENEFPGAILKERHRGMLQFRLPAKGVKLPRIFAVVQEAKERLKLEDYALCQTTLDQVFISFAEQQEEQAVAAANFGSPEIRAVTPEVGQTETPETGDLLCSNGRSHPEEEDRGTGNSRPVTASQISTRLQGDSTDNFFAEPVNTKF